MGEPIYGGSSHGLPANPPIYGGAGIPTNPQVVPRPGGGTAIIVPRPTPTTPTTLPPPSLLPGLAPAARTPFQWSNAELQAAADSISHAAFGANGVTGVPISVTVTPGGRVVVSQARQLPSSAARARAREIFGENVEFVGGTTRGNAPGLRGGDAEARAIHFLGDEAQGARQATTHYACPHCEARQNAGGVINVTGTQSQHGQITRPIGGN